jgi:alkylation response protein AidB-like acyl-CoA dehydrogenase
LKSVDFLLVEKDRPGFQANKPKGKLGIEASDTAKIVLSNVKVPKKNLIGGKRGQGFPQVIAQVVLQRGYEVVVREAEQVFLDKGLERMTVSFE